MNNELSQIFNSFVSKESLLDSALILDSYDGPINIEWENDLPVTPYGSLVFFIEYLNISGIFDALVDDFPFCCTSNNAPKSRNIIGSPTIL